MEAMTEFNFSGETIRCIWRLGLDEVMNPSKSIDVALKKKKKKR